MHSIWHTIDFKVHKRFVNASNETIEKYGHLIRVVDHIQEPSQLNSLQQCATTDRLSSFTAYTCQDPQLLADCFDIISNNNSRLTTIKLNHNSADANYCGSRIRVPVDAHITKLIGSTSKLSHLQLRGYILARASLSTLLRGCPALKSVDLEDTHLISGRDVIDMYKHSGVTHLSMRTVDLAKDDSEGQVDQVQAQSQTIVAHFPNLVALTLQLRGRNKRVTFPMRAIKEAQGAWNAESKSLETDFLPESVTEELLVQVPGDLTKVLLNYHAVTSSVILAILAYRNILTAILTSIPHSGFYEDEDTVPMVNDHFQGSSWMIQALPRQCPKLETLELPEHEMDMDEVEAGEWACKDLTELRVRIKGLDTAEKIDGALARWNRLKSPEQHANAGSPIAIMLPIESARDMDDDEDVMLIERRVVRHLLRFEKLTTVWLGTKVWST
ncbi:hypothetical protein BGX28_004075 [Mortierella sp. GBA30]|nr:hypothetical protein BGX28_004075 [Mortierella sp. GBA30]